MANFCTTCGTPMAWSDQACPACGTPAAIVYDMGTMQKAMAQNMKQQFKEQAKQQFKQQLKQNAGIHVQPTVNFLGKDIALGKGIHFNPFDKKGG
ncbi:MAG: hypothetical protein E7474_11625 [Ruminococcaceae bacterium]|nr:hypothetical protein [Oscillospiraceae bacterium]